MYGIVYMVALSCPKYQGKVCCVWGGLDVMQLTHCKLTLAFSCFLVPWKTCHVRASQVNFQINGVFLFQLYPTNVTVALHQDTFTFVYCRVLLKVFGAAFCLQLQQFSENIVCTSSIILFFTEFYGSRYVALLQQCIFVISVHKIKFHSQSLFSFFSVLHKVFKTTHQT